MRALGPLVVSLSVSVLLAAILLGGSSPTVAAELPGFFADLARENAESFEPRYADAFATLCLEQNLDASAAANVALFHRIHFLHDLFTSNAAVDCARGGILDIPYFWHWVDPNPRHEILLQPDSVSLASLSPPPPYERYRTYGDIDRVPVLYLGDLLAESPRYSHPDCGEFYTFGWCSEREMAFVALLGLLGHEGKIYQSGIHTWSVIRCSFRSSSGAEIILAAAVDNTFDTVRWELVPPEVLLENWLADVGEGTTVRWYNRKARSEDQRSELRALEVPPATAERIAGQVRDAVSASP